MGLKPAGPEDSYFQPFNLVSATLGEENLLEVFHGPNASIRLHAGQDYYPHRFSASAHVKAPVVYVGFGISAPKLSYDDYEGEAVRGSIVLVLEHEPGEKDPNSPFEGVVSSEYSRQLTKALVAQEKGAVGVLFVQDVHNHPGPDNFDAEAQRYWPEEPRRRQRYNLASMVERIRIPVLQISSSLAQTMVLGTGRSFQELSRAAETEHGMSSLPLPGIEVEVTSSMERHIVPDRNVVALIEGSDPRVKDEWVIICAHYDHVGVSEGGDIYNGADDDGSGIVAVLEVAEAYALAAASGQRPRRGILFAAWDAEESGLLGAWAYTESPLTPLQKTVAVLNMDTIRKSPKGAAGVSAGSTSRPQRRTPMRSTSWGTLTAPICSRR